MKHSLNEMQNMPWCYIIWKIGLIAIIQVKLKSPVKSKFTSHCIFIESVLLKNAGAMHDNVWEADRPANDIFKQNVSIIYYFFRTIFDQKLTSDLSTASCLLSIVASSNLFSCQRQISKHYIVCIRGLGFTLTKVARWLFCASLLTTLKWSSIFWACSHSIPESGLGLTTIHHGQI